MCVFARGGGLWNPPQIVWREQPYLNLSLDHLRPSWALLERELDNKYASSLKMVSLPIIPQWAVKNDLVIFDMKLYREHFACRTQDVIWWNWTDFILLAQEITRKNEKS